MAPRTRLFVFLLVLIKSVFCDSVAYDAQEGQTNINVCSAALRKQCGFDNCDITVQYCNKGFITPKCSLCADKCQAIRIGLDRLRYEDCYTICPVYMERQVCKAQVPTIPPVPATDVPLVESAAPTSAISTSEINSKEITAMAILGAMVAVLLVLVAVLSMKCYKLRLDNKVLKSQCPAAIPDLPTNAELGSGSIFTRDIANEIQDSPMNSETDNYPSADTSKDCTPPKDMGKSKKGDSPKIVDPDETTPMMYDNQRTSEEYIEQRPSNQTIADVCQPKSAKHARYTSGGLYINQPSSTPISNERLHDTRLVRGPQFGRSSFHGEGPEHDQIAIRHGSPDDSGMEGSNENMQQETEIKQTV